MSGPFYDAMPGPERRDTLNQMWTTYLEAIANAAGYSPMLSVVPDGARRVLHLYDWEGSGASKPAITGYLGPAGVVPNIADASDVRGPQGAAGPANSLAIGTVVEGSAAATITGVAPAQTLNLSIPRGLQGLQGIQGPKGDTGLQGPQGPKGDTGPQGVQGLAGLHGWTPKFAVVTDGTRRVQQVVDWFGGTGSKPATGEYVGATGLVATIAQAVDIRGPSGAGTGNVNPTGAIAANDLAAFADSTGQVIKALKAADLPVSTATQTALDGKAPLNGTGTSGTWPISTTGNAATATKLTTARAINGVNFDGTANITVADATKLPLAGGTVTGELSSSAINSFRMKYGSYGTFWRNDGSDTYLMVTASGDPDGTYTAARPLVLNNATGVASINGNAATATKLATARTINGVDFDGSANISVSVGWASVTGKPAVIAAGADAAAARTAIGAGTSNLADAPSNGKTYGRKDATWVEASSNAMSGATASAAGSGGSVPAPPAGAQNKFLRGDGTWAAPTAGVWVGVMFLDTPGSANFTAPEDGTYRFTLFGGGGGGGGSGVPTSGGTTSVAALASAVGGGAGSYTTSSSAAAGGAPGTGGSGNTSKMPGGAGGPSSGGSSNVGGGGGGAGGTSGAGGTGATGVASGAPGGAGGGALSGAGGTGSRTTAPAAAGTIGMVYGAGGGGGNGGGGGGGGECVVSTHVLTNGQTLACIVGAGGGGGSSAGEGASGAISIERLA